MPRVFKRRSREVGVTLASDSPASRGTPSCSSLKVSTAQLLPTK
jgi:hypothetical protein